MFSTPALKKALAKKIKKFYENPLTISPRGDRM
nr:MAG TPA: carboxyltransferase domain protein [Caudoviricetes sp.]